MNSAHVRVNSSKSEVMPGNVLWTLWILSEIRGRVGSVSKAFFRRLCHPMFCFTSQGTLTIRVSDFRGARLPQTGCLSYTAQQTLRLLPRSVRLQHSKVGYPLCSLTLGHSSLFKVYLLGRLPLWQRCEEFDRILTIYAVPAQCGVHMWAVIARDWNP